jgi:hypothetical protein
MAEDVRITAERLKYLEALEAQLAEHVLISKKRLAELEAGIAKKELDKETIIIEYKRQRLQALREKDRCDVSGVRLRVQRYNERHRDEILEKRKQKKEEKKEAKKEAKKEQAGDTATNTLSIS